MASPEEIGTFLRGAGPMASPEDDFKETAQTMQRAMRAMKEANRIPQSEIGQRADRLVAQIETLGTSLEALFEAIRPALGPDSPNEIVEEPWPSVEVSDLARFFDERNRELETLIMRVHRCKARVEL